MNAFQELAKEHKEERTGLEFTMNSGAKCKIIEYIDSKHIRIRFDSGFETMSRWDRINAGTVKDHRRSRQWGDNVIIDVPVENICDDLAFIRFQEMHTRCYNEQYKIQRPTYKDVFCCEEWNYYSVFKDWFYSQPNLETLINSGKRFELDKDILIKGNKKYSPDTCCIVPAIVNQIFLKHQGARGDLPIGVTTAVNGKYVIAKWNNPISGKAEWSSVFPNTEQGIVDAYLTYKSHKEDIIKEVARREFKKGTIIEKCYDAMMNYEVEITD